MYSAYYMPALDGRPDPSRDGFQSEDEAWEYVFTQMCKWCQRDRESYLQLIKNGIDPLGREYEDDHLSAMPGCTAYWMVTPTDEGY